MSTLKEMAAEYREAAARLALRIEEKRAAGAPEYELKELRAALRDVRDAAHLLSGYYDVPRAGTGAAVDWRARRTRDDQ